MIRVALVASLLALACARKLSTSGSLSFLALGDWGGQPSSPYYTTAEKDIAAAMGKTAQNVGSQFTIALGDNFYDMGVTNVNDPRFKETFEVDLNAHMCWAIANMVFNASSLSTTSGRTCLRLARYNPAGTHCAGTTITMVTPRQKWRTLSSRRDGTCQTSTTQR